MIDAGSDDWCTPIHGRFHAGVDWRREGIFYPQYTAELVTLADHDMAGALVRSAAKERSDIANATRDIYDRHVTCGMCRRCLEAQVTLTNPDRGSPSTGGASSVAS